MTTAARNIRLRYFALLREQAGMAEEAFATEATTPVALYAELLERHPFTLPLSSLRVAIDGDFTDPLTPLTDGCEVVFIPPVAGG
ncbi:MAG: MoaD/ThiS family protein [Opitutales bacterium]